LDYQRRPGGRKQAKTTNLDYDVCTKKKLTCIYSNVDSLIKKITELSYITVQTAPDVIALTEIFPKNSRFPVTENDIQIANYNCYTNIAESTARRGVAIYVKNSIQSRCASVNFHFTESIWCEMDLKDNDKLLIGCIYRSPNSSLQNNELLNQSLKIAAETCSHILIMGDFNHPDINWDNGTSPPDENHRATKFLEAVRDSFLHQHVTQPTHIRGGSNPTCP
jgi:exonuclease III